MLADRATSDDVIDPLLDAIDRFATERIDAVAIDREQRIPPDVLEGLAELGLFSVTIPEAFGGAGLGLAEACRVVTALAAHDRSVATTVGLHLGLGTRGLVVFGSPAQHERYLPGLAAGRTIASFAATEPDAGSDLTAISTTARPKADALVVDGAKIFVTNGGIAGLYTLLVATPGLGGARRGHSLLLLEPGDPGLTVGPEETKLGLRGSSTTPLYLEGVRVPRDRVVGEPGQGMDAAHQVLAWGRTVMAAGCLGAVRPALDATVLHLARRRQFGRALGRFELVRHQLADMAATVFAMGAVVRHASESGEDGPLEPRSMAAKIACSDGNWQVCDAGIQLHGGVGFTEESGLPLLLRDARITRIFEGANDVLLLKLGSMEAVGGVPRSLRRPVDTATAAHAEAVHARLVEQRNELARAHGVRLLRRQLDLHELGRLVVLRETADAVALRAEADGTPLSRSLAAHWLALVRRRLSRAPHPPGDMGPVEAIADALLAEVSS